MRGFTLLEVMAAILLTGVAISGGVMLFSQLDDESMRLRVESAAVSERGNGQRLLRALLHNAEATTDTSKRFRGDERSATYRSWCATSSGWLERCEVILTVNHDRDSSTIIAQLSTKERYAVMTLGGAVELRYLDLAGRDSGWVRYWGESLALPTAVAVVGERDTLVLPLGASRD